ncbi:MAG: CRTAC1 family protein [Planctomycetota bacterium]|nr:CRTAC1 family protein [Planctomycetota bacterium]
MPYLMVVVAVTYFATRGQTEYEPLERYVNEHIPKIITRLPKMAFTEVTREAGIDFVHETGHYGEVLFPEVNGPGCGFFDFDNDGDQDIFLVNSGKWPHKTDGNGPTVIHSLYVNDGRGHFTDLGEDFGLSARVYGHGVCFGDVDNDGFTDVYVTCVGRNILYRNEAGKLFKDITEEAEVGGDVYSTAATFFDYDTDGKIDLFVANYVEWSVEIEREAHQRMDKKLAESGKDLKSYMAESKAETDKKRVRSLVDKGELKYADSYAFTPDGFKKIHCALYRNVDGKRFEDVSEQSGVWGPGGLDEPAARGMAVAVFDCNEDGWPDLSVANDQEADFLFINQQDGTFKDEAGALGTALANNGTGRAGMGMDWAYFGNDERLALVVSNYIGQDLGFYLRPKKDSEAYIDAASMVGVAQSTRDVVMWGNFFFDMDLDGLQDLFVANGHVARGRALFSNQPYEQSSVLLWNTGEQPEFIQLDSGHVGDDLFEKMVARGAAYADIEGDGDLDILVATNGGPARLFRNDLEARTYLRMKLVGTTSNRSALGARVTLYTGPFIQIREVIGGHSYSSQSEMILTFGLGAMPPPDKATIIWPSGVIQEVTKLPTNRVLTIVEPSPENSGAEQP